jgi:peptidoglycan/LPS O-acetylase OafA/YrhL
MRRALRIFPPYYFLLTILFVLLPAFAHLPSDFSAEPARQSWYWLYAVNWSWIRGVEGVRALGHCWSLSVEEQFYLLWPPIVFALRRRTVAWLCVILAIAALGIRIWIVGSGKDSGLAYALTVARMDALAIGALTAILVRRWQTMSTLLPRLARGGWLILAALVVSGLITGGYALRNPRTLTLGHTILALSAAWLILIAVRDNCEGRGRIGKALAWSPLRLFGKHSYAIYLFHHPIDMAINRLFLGEAVAGLTSWQYLGVQIAYWVVGSLGLLALAMVFHVALERPILTYKRHFEADRRPHRG